MGENFMRKKVFSVLLVLTMLSMMVSAFATAAGPQKYDNVELTLLNCWNGAMKHPSDLYNNAVAAAIREKTGVTVTIEGIMMSETEKLNLIFASGDMPDIIDAPNWGGNAGETAVIKKAAAEGMLVAVEDLVPNYPNIKDAFDVGVISQAFLENDIDDPSFGGHRYVIPVETPGDEANITNWAYGVFVRGDVPGALGVNVADIKTSEQLYDFMVKARDYGFKDINGNDTIVATTYHEGWDYGRYAESFNQKKLTNYTKDENGKITLDVLSDQFIQKNMFLWKLVKENLLDKECFKQNDAQADEKVGNGTALFAAAQYGPIINSTKLTGLYTSNPEMRYIPVGPLTYSDGSPLTQIEQMGRHGAHAFLITKSCKNPEAALAWLDYINSEEGMRLCEYGIEGDTYEMNADGQPRLKEEWLALKREGQDIYDAGLREKGIGYYLGGRFVSNTKLTWWGESEAGGADAAVKEIEAYRLQRPVERLPGYPISSLVSTYKDFNTVMTEIIDDETQKQYRERAYFADTEAEALEILKSYQEMVKTKNNGMITGFLEYAQQMFDSREDAAY
jgi:putative aldouronate transport system substrate-binding protein